MWPPVGAGARKKEQNFARNPASRLAPGTCGASFASRRFATIFTNSMCGAAVLLASGKASFRHQRDEQNKASDHVCIIASGLTQHVEKDTTANRGQMK